MSAVRPIRSVRQRPTADSAVRNSSLGASWNRLTPFPLTLALSPAEREKVTQRWVTTSAFGVTKTECRAPSPGGRGLG